MALRKKLLPVSGIVRSHQNGGTDPLDQTAFAVWIDRLQKISIVYLENHPDLLQIRYIGLVDEGRENMIVTMIVVFLLVLITTLLICQKLKPAKWRWRHLSLTYCTFWDHRFR